MGKLAAIQFSSSIHSKIPFFVLIFILSGLSIGCRGPWFKKIDNIEPLTVTEQPEQRSSRAFASARLRPSPVAGTQATAPRPASPSRQVSDAANAVVSDDESLEQLPDDGTLTAEQRDIFKKQLTAIQNAAIKNKVTSDLLEGDEVSSNPVIPAGAAIPAGASEDSSSTQFSMNDNEESPQFEAEENTKVQQAVGSQAVPQSSNKPVRSQSREGERAMKSMAGVEPLGAQRPQNNSTPKSLDPRKPNTSHLVGPKDSVDHSNVDNSTTASVAIETPAGDWRALAQESLAALQAEANNSTTLSPAQKLAIETKKRMLSLVLDDLEGSMTPIEFLAADERDYFVHQFQALHAAIDPQGNPVLNRRWTIALQSQRKAQSHLAAVSNLEVQNVAFCNEVDSFGIISKFPQYNFRHDQELLLYCELDNFVSEKLKSEYETKLQGSYEIVDKDGRRVADQMLPPDVHVCNNQRRDYFIAYRMYMPQEIAPGRYSLKLTIEDMKGHKFGQSSVDFQIIQ